MTSILERHLLPDRWFVLARAGLLTDSELDRLVDELKAIDRGSAWDRVRKTGSLVLTRLAGGDEAAWQSRKGRRTLSLRRLVQRPDCPFKKSALASAVNVHLFVTHHAWVLELSSVTPTHVMQVLTAPEAEATALLRDAATHGWSVRELASRVHALRKLSGERRGRPTTSSACKAVTVARQILSLLRSAQGLLQATDSRDEAYNRLLRMYLDEIIERAAQVGTLVQPSTSERLQLRAAR